MSFDRMGRSVILRLLGVVILFMMEFANNRLYATDRVEQSKLKKRVRNLPDIELTTEHALAIDQEINIYSMTAVSNTSLDYGLPQSWNIGASFLNFEFYASQADAWSFQPDILFNLEKHWDLAAGRIVTGTQTGVGFLTQGSRLINYSYLDFQQRVPVLDADLDIGAYYGNAALAGRDSVGFHFNMEIPLGNLLRLNGDYLSGSNGVSAATLKLLCPLGKNWQLAAGIQIAGAQNTGDDYAGILGFYWH